MHVKIWHEPVRSFEYEVDDLLSAALRCGTVVLWEGKLCSFIKYDQVSRPRQRIRTKFPGANPYGLCIFSSFSLKIYHNWNLSWIVFGLPMKCNYIPRTSVYIKVLEDISKGH